MNTVLVAMLKYVAAFFVGTSLLTLIIFWIASRHAQDAPAD